MQSYRSSVLSATLPPVIEAAPTPTIEVIADHVPSETGSAIVELNGVTMQTVALLRAPRR